ncbi:hypothetical protein Tco_0649686 [Tanacetum coccineum]
MSMTIQSGVKDKILATSSETPKVENAPAEMLRDMDQQMEKRADDGKANVYGVRGMILAAQSEAFKQENILVEILHGLDQQMERKGDRSLYFIDRIWVPFVGGVRTVIMDEAHKSRKLQAERDRQKSFMRNSGHKMTEYEVGESVLLKVSPWKCVMRFCEKGNNGIDEVNEFERIRYPLVKVRWDSKRGPEFT